MDDSCMRHVVQAIYPVTYLVDDEDLPLIVDHSASIAFAILARHPSFNVSEGSCTIWGMSGVPPRLSLVTIGARDLPALRRFYRGLGWTELAVSDDNWAAFLLGGVLFTLYPVDDLKAEAAPDLPARSGWSGVTLACNVDSAEQVDAAFSAAVAAGAIPVREPADRPWGGRAGYFADPEGNRWEVAWASTAVFDARGALVSFG